MDRAAERRLTELPLDRDPAALAAAAEDFGHIVHRTPAAVLRPRAVHDISALLALSTVAGQPVAARGRGHASFGQPQTTGTVLDLRGLARVHEVTADRVVVDAGASWLDWVWFAAAKRDCDPVGILSPGQGIF